MSGFIYKLIILELIVFLNAPRVSTIIFDLSNIFLYGKCLCAVVKIVKS